MNKARTGKVAVISEVKARVDTTTTAVVTEYRGLTVAEISSLRRSLRAADAEYKVLKNTLVRRAVEGTPSESITEFLVGPTAIAWVKGDISAVAKILRDFAKATPALILKGGVLNGRALTAKELTALADLPSREVLLAQVAGMIAAPMRQMASLFKAVPQSLAYGLAALIESKGGVVEVSAPEPEISVALAEEASVVTSDDATDEVTNDVAAPADDAAVVVEELPAVTEEVPAAAEEELPEVSAEVGGEEAVPVAVDAEQSEQ